MYQILIVDDERTVCQGMQQLIDWNQLGFEISGVARNGREALDLQRQYHYDLIITDLKMPVMDGIELIQALAKEEHNCKVIIVSAYGEFTYAQTAMQYGVQYYLLKPVEESVLCGYLSKIAEDLSKRSKEINSNSDKKLFEHQYNLSANGVVMEMRRYVSAHYAEPLSLNSLAMIYNFSPVYLGRIFKKETGCSFNEYLNRYRIEIAREYMEQGNMSVSEIANHVGYNDVKYFYKCFRDITGFTIKEYKNKTCD